MSLLSSKSNYFSVWEFLTFLGPNWSKKSHFLCTPNEEKIKICKWSFFFYTFSTVEEKIKWLFLPKSGRWSWFFGFLFLCFGYGAEFHQINSYPCHKCWALIPYGCTERGENENLGTIWKYNSYTIKSRNLILNLHALKLLSENPPFLSLQCWWRIFIYFLLLS